MLAASHCSRGRINLAGVVVVVRCCCCCCCCAIDNRSSAAASGVIIEDRDMYVAVKRSREVELQGAAA